MNKLFSVLFLLFVVSTAISQTKVDLVCGYTVPYGQTVTIDTLNMSCAQTILVQDNSKLIIKNVVGTGELHFRYGDIYEEVADRSTLIELVQKDIDGNFYTDYRLPTDVNGQVTFECTPKLPVIVGDYVNVELGIPCEDYELVDDYPIENEQNLECIVFDFNGREIYRGVYSGLFRNDCGTCIQDGLENKVLIIRFINGKNSYTTKRLFYR